MDDKHETEKYAMWGTYTVREMRAVGRSDGTIPMIVLPVSLIGKTVKVTVEEQ